MCALAAIPWFGHAARAADEGKYPNRPIVLVLPSPVGGTSDLLARLIGVWLQEALGQPVVIEAKPGAAGRIAVDHVAAATPDGYTLLVANNGANAILPAGSDARAIDPAKRFAPIIMLARLPIVVAVHPALGVNTLPGLITLARRQPGVLSYASGGIGSTSHLAADVLFRRAGVRLVHVPYAGTSAAVKDVLSGEVPVIFTHLGTVASLIRTGRLRALAVTGDHRMAEFPEVQTVAEAGYRGFDVTTWHGLVAPMGTPHAVIARLNEEMVRAVGRPEVRSQLAALGMEPMTSSPEEFARALAEDVRIWSQVLRAMRNPTE